MRAVAAVALYPHGPLSTLAEWSWLDGDRTSARAEMMEAIATAPQHRRGRLRTRLAEWHLALDNPVAAREQLERAIDEDPSYARSREVLSETIGRLRKLSG
jgi:Tfp pilus assembly protein PilF